MTMRNFDYQAQFEAVKKSAMDALKEIFPVEGKIRSLRIGNLWVEDKADPKDYAGQSALKNKEGTWGVPIYASMDLIDKASGKVIDHSEKVKLFNLPKITDRFSYIVKGNEYQVTNQLRLKPGVYTLRKQNGELKTQINLAKGRNFDLAFTENSGLFTIKKIGGGQANIPLYPVLTHLGMSAQAISSAWGSKLEAANRLTDPKVIQRAEDAFGVKKGELKNYLDTTQISSETTKIVLGQPFEKVDGPMILAASKHLLEVHLGKKEPTDRDSLTFKELHSVEDFIHERIQKNKKNLSFKVSRNIDNPKRIKVEQIVNPEAFSSIVESFFTQDDKSATPEQTNPLEMLSGAYKATIMGSGGITSEHAITSNMREIHPTHYGFLDPIHSPESNVGVNVHLTMGAVKDGKGIKMIVVDKNKKPTALTPIEAFNKKIAFPNQMGPKYKVLFHGKVIEVPENEVEFYTNSTLGLFSPTTNLVPYLPADQGNRAMMASKMLEQAISLKHREQPLVQVGIKEGHDLSMEQVTGKQIAIVAPDDGIVKKITPDFMILKTAAGDQKLNLYNHYSLNRKSFIHHTPLVKEGDKVKKDQVLADSNYTRNGVLALGANLKTAYVPYKGFNFDDGIVITEGAAEKLTSEHIHKKTYDKDLLTILNLVAFKSNYPNAITSENAKKLDAEGVIKKGEVVKHGDILIASLRKRNPSVSLALLGKSLSERPKDDAVRWTQEDDGVVMDVQKGLKGISVQIKTEERAKIGDKLAGRHGNKGVITHIIQDSMSPRNAEGEHVEVLLNPTGVISRINIGQIYESAAAKAADKMGTTFKVSNFTGENYLETTKKYLKKAGVNDKEELFDAETGKSIGEVHVGKPQILKLFKQASANFSVRQGGPGHPYDANMQPLKAGGEEASKALDVLTMYSLLSHGARANLREMSTLKSSSNDEYWKALKSGQPLPTPKSPFVYDKFINYLKGAGIDVKKTGTKMQLGPLTDKALAGMTSGEIKNPRFYRAKDLQPIKGGLFDPVVMGGFNGNKWGHINLTEPTLNPIFENAAKKITGLGGKFDEILDGKLHIDSKGELNKDGKGLTGGAAIEKILKGIDVESEIRLLTKKAKVAKGAVLDDTNKKLRYLTALKESDLKPHEAYIRRTLPVVPTVYRPIYPRPDGNVTVSDLNFLYQNTGVINTMMKMPVMEMLSEEEKVNIRSDLYNHVKGLSGLTDINIKGRAREGFISEIKGGTGGQPKEGLFISKLLSKKQDYVGRGTIIPDSDLGVDEMGMPEQMAWKLFEPFVIREMKNQGKTPLQAKDEINRKTLLAKSALDMVMKDRHVLLNRAPSLHKFSIMAFRPKIVSGKSIKIQPLVNKSFNADYDGDQQLTSILTLIDRESMNLLKENFGSTFVETRIMTARYREKLPIISDGEVLLINLEDFPHGGLLGKKEGEKGPIEFYKALPGFKVLAYNDVDNSLAWQEVYGWSKHLQREIEIVTLSSGKQIFTDDDPRAVYGVERGSLNLVRNTPSRALETKMLVPRSKNVMEDFSKESDMTHCWGEYLSFDFGYIIGTVASNGWVEHRYGEPSGYLFLSTLCEEIGEKFFEIGKKIFEFEYNELEYNRDNGEENCFGKTKKWAFKSYKAAKILLDAVGAGSRNKHLPACFLSAPRTFREGILTGLMDNDGSISISNAKGKPQLLTNYTTASVRLAQEIQWLASSLGIKCSVSTTKTPLGEPFYCCSLSSIDMKKWGCKHMIHPNKVEVFHSCEVNEACASAASQDIVPITSGLATEIQKAVGAPRLGSKDRKALYTIFSKSSKVGYISRIAAKRVFNWVPEDVCKTLPGWAGWWAIVENEAVTWDKVESVEKTGIKEDGYDLTVPGYETFMNVDGVVLSNTMTAHAPISDEANREAEKMRPSRNLFQPGTGQLMIAPSQESLLGLYYLSKTPQGRSRINKLSKLIPKSCYLDVPLDKAGARDYAMKLARTLPANEFGIVIKELKSEGEKHAFERGFTLGINDLAQISVKRDALVKSLKAKILGVRNPEELSALNTVYTKKIDELLGHALKGKDNPLYDMIDSGAKGSATNLRSIMATPLLVTDAKGIIVPKPISKSYTEGLDIDDYWLSMYGARRGMMDRAIQTSLPGAFSKDVMATTLDNVISGEDCGTKEGIALPVESSDALDRFTAGDQSGIAHNTVVDTSVIAKLRKVGAKTIKVRSPLRCLKPKGTCAKCYGIDEHGHAPEVGENIGAKAGQTISEPLYQMVLNCTEGLITDSTGKMFALEDYFEEISGEAVKEGNCITKYTDYGSEVCVIDDGNGVRTSSIQGHLPEDHMLFFKTKAGHSMLVQANHPLWIYDEEGSCCEIYAEDVKIGDRFKIDRSCLERVGIEDAPFDPYFIGRYLADGSTRYGNGTPRYVGVPIATIVTGADIEIKNKTLRSSQGLGASTKKDVQIFKPEFADKFRYIVRGRSAKEKRLQPGFNLWKKQDLIKVMAGYIDGDSYCFLKHRKTTVARISTSSYLVLQQLEIICNLLDIKFNPTALPYYEPQKSPAFTAELRFKDDAVYKESIKLGRLEFYPAKYRIKHEEFEPITGISRMWSWNRLVWDLKTSTAGFTCGMIRNHNSFHTGGTAGGPSSGGYGRINQLLQLPKVVVGAATLAPVTGKITKITKGLAGGFDVVVVDKLVHVSKGLTLKVVVGQQVEAGDPLSDGVIKPQDLVKHKGMQAAQAYMASELQQAYSQQGQKIQRKVFETVVRSLGNTTKVLNNPKDTGHLPGDVIPYTVAEYHNKNLEQEVPVEESAGHKLAKGIGDFKAGHILSADDSKMLKAKGISMVLIELDPIVHAPLLKGMSTLPLLKRNWMAALGYRHLAKNLVEGAGQGWTTDLADYHPIPAFAHGETFGKGKDGKY